MKRFRRARPGAVAARFVLAALIGLVAAPVAAQGPDARTPRLTAGWGGSWFSYGPFLEADPERLEADVGLEDGLGAMVHVDVWLTAWLGVRLDALYDRTQVQLPEEAPSLNIWAANLGGILRPARRAMLPVDPYLFATGGLISYGLGGQSHNVSEQIVYDAGATEQFLVQAGGGLDIELLDTWEGNVIGVRLEVARLIPWDRPFRFADQASEGRLGVWRLSAGLSTAIF